MSEIFKIEKVISQLPQQLDKNTIYIVRTGNGFEMFVTDLTGSIAHNQNKYVFNQTDDGFAPKTGTPTNTRYLRDDGTWSVPPNTTYTSANGITLTSTQFTPNYGTAANTIAQGNDSRILNGATAYSWGNHASQNYLKSVPQASNTVLGGVKVGNNLSISNDGILSSTYVDTTYSAGAGLTQSGTVFSLPVTVSGTGTYVQSVVQNTTGITVTLGTPPNTTYSAPSLSELQTGTATTSRAITAKVLNDWGNSKYVPLARTIASLPLSSNITLDQLKSAIGTVSSSVSGLMSADDKTNLEALVALLTKNNDNVANTISEILEIFQTYPEGANIADALAQKADKTTFTKTVNGLVPAPTGSTSTRYLREDGTWVVPTNNTYSSGTGIKLTGSQFSVDFSTVSTGSVVTSVEQTATGIKVTYGNDISGNSATTTKLKTPVKINNIDFDGSSSITINANQVTNFCNTIEKVDAALTPGLYIITNVSIANLYNYGFMQVYQNNEQIHQTYYAHNNNGNGSVVVRQSWDSGVSWAGWRVLDNHFVNNDVSGEYNGSDQVPWTSNSGVYRVNDDLIAHFKGKGSTPAFQLRSKYNNNGLWYRTARDNFGFESDWSKIVVNTDPTFADTITITGIGDQANAFKKLIQGNTTTDGGYIAVGNNGSDKGYVEIGTIDDSDTQIYARKRGNNNEVTQELTLLDTNNDTLVPNNLYVGKKIRAPYLYLSGSNFDINEQGSYFSWNKNNGSGSTDIINHKGLGVGGFDFWSGNTDQMNRIARIDETGKYLGYAQKVDLSISGINIDHNITSEELSDSIKSTSMIGNIRDTAGLALMPMYLDSTTTNQFTAVIVQGQTSYSKTRVPTYADLDSRGLYQELAVFEPVNLFSFGDKCIVAYRCLVLNPSTTNSMNIVLNDFKNNDPINVYVNYNSVYSSIAANTTNLTFSIPTGISVIDIITLGSGFSTTSKIQDQVTMYAYHQLGTLLPQIKSTILDVQAVKKIWYNVTTTGSINTSVCAEEAFGTFTKLQVCKLNGILYLRGALRLKTGVTITSSTDLFTITVSSFKPLTLGIGKYLNIVELPVDATTTVKFGLTYTSSTAVAFRLFNEASDITASKKGQLYVFQDVPIGTY